MMHAFVAYNKSSAVAEMATVPEQSGPKCEGAAVPLSVGEELGPHLTQCRLDRGVSRTKWHFDSSIRLATIHQRYRQTGHRSASIRRTVLSRGSMLK